MFTTFTPAPIENEHGNPRSPTHMFCETNFASQGSGTGGIQCILSILGVLGKPGCTVAPRRRDGTGYKTIGFHLSDRYAGAFCGRREETIH